jgi:hypothetical protein
MKTDFMVVLSRELRAAIPISYYNPRVETGDLKILLALEPTWTVSLNGLEFLALPSSEISLEDSTIRLGRYSRKILDLQWLRPNVVRIRARLKFRSQPDVITLYPGDRLPSMADLRRRRRIFQDEIGRALSAYFGVRKFERQILYSDRRHGIGGAYPRFLAGRHAAIAVDPDESTAVINGIMRAALLWAPLIRRRVAIVVPRGREQTISARLCVMPHLRRTFQWLKWDGHAITLFESTAAEPETHVQDFTPPDVGPEVARICALAPELLQAVPNIAGRAISIRLRGIEVAQVSEKATTYPLGEPTEQVVRELDAARRYGSRHPLARAHEERWLESNLISQIHQVFPTIDVRHIYPQVPSFVGEERNIIDLLTITNEGRMVVIEIKAVADPDLPLQALDYWIAVERHRKAGDFVKKGYFSGCTLRNEPAVLVLVAPLLAYHKTIGRLIRALPAEAPLMEIGINQSWKRQIKILRRRGVLG